MTEPKYKCAPLGDVGNSIADIERAIAQLAPPHISDGVNPLADNYRRAHMAALGLWAYAEETRTANSEPAYTTISDFLSDLLHLLDAMMGTDPDEEPEGRGVAWDVLHGLIRNIHYEAEIRGVF